MQPVVDAMGAMDDSGYQGIIPAPRDFWHSDQINEIAGALAKAQGAMLGAAKDATNPHFRSKYADLASVWEACRKPLSDNGIAVIQLPAAHGAEVTMTTMLVHSSGQFFANTLVMASVSNQPQPVGSCITYARRYALAALVGVAPEDDDGNAAQGSAEDRAANQRNARPPAPVPPVSQPRPVAQRTQESSVDAMLNDMATTAGSLKVFAKLKSGLAEVLGKEAGERKFYELLGAHGVEKETEFKSSGPAKACAKEMLSVIHTADGMGV